MNKVMQAYIEPTEPPTADTVATTTPVVRPGAGNGCPEVAALETDYHAVWESKPLPAASHPRVLPIRKHNATMTNIVTINVALREGKPQQIATRTAVLRASHPQRGIRTTTTRNAKKTKTMSPPGCCTASMPLRRHQRAKHCDICHRRGADAATGGADPAEIRPV